MTEILNTSIKACNQFFYFAMNYSPGFIQQVWADQEMLAEHLQEKFDDLQSRFGYAGVMNAFYAELDSSCRIKLLTWVMTEWSNNFTVGLEPQISDKEQ